MKKQQEMGARKKKEREEKAEKLRKMLEEEAERRKEEEKRKKNLERAKKEEMKKKQTNNVRKAPAAGAVDEFTPISKLAEKKCLVAVTTSTLFIIFTRFLLAPSCKTLSYRAFEYEFVDEFRSRKA